MLQPIFLTVTPETVEKLNAFKSSMDYYSNIILAFGIVTSVLILIVHFIRLAASENNSLQRNKILKDIGVSLVITAVLGSVGLISKIIIYMFT